MQKPKPPGLKPIKVGKKHSGNRHWALTKCTALEPKSPGFKPTGVTQEYLVHEQVKLI